jgi:hypothetical protein
MGGHYGSQHKILNKGGLVKSPLLVRLDEIEQLDYEPGVNGEALDIMQAFAQGFEDLEYLIEHYAGSYSANVASYLAFLLAEKADEAETADDADPELYRLLFSFMAKFRHKYEPMTLQCCLKTLYLLLIYECVWPPDSQASAVLYPFLQKCLDYSYSSRDAVSVQRWAAQVTSYLFEYDLLEQVTNSRQLTWLREKLLHLSARKLDMLDDVLTWLPQFRAKEQLFIHSPVLDHLDRLEQLTIENASENASGFDKDIFALMEAFAQGIDELWILVERYGDSSARTCVVTLTSLAAIMSQSPNLNTLQIIFSLIEKIRSRNEPVIFGSCLSAIQQQIKYGHGWQHDTQPPTLLYPFLQYCLAYPDDATRYNALHLLALLCEEDLLTVGIAQSDLAFLYEGAVQASSAIRSDPSEPVGEMLPDLSPLAKYLGVA